MKTRALLTVLWVIILGTAPARADEGLGDAQLRDALEQAGGNRPALEAVLAHYEGHPEGQRLEAARFLIANMADKGYIVTSLRDAKGETVAYDPLAYTDFKEALAALEALEQQHGELEFARDHKVLDLETITSAYLIRHIDQAFEAWRGTPEPLRVDFDTFRNYVLPHRGSQEPLDDWIGPLRRRYAARARDLGGKLDVQGLYRWLSEDVHRRVRFDERYYLHPTDQGFTEMGRTGQGRCEDITNMITFAARSLALATAADYTPYWAHRDNNHAWNVLLDRQGRGFAKSNAHAAKIYRKTYAIQRDSLPFHLPEGREAPNRFMASKTAVDVTDQYAPTTDVTVSLAPAAVGEEEVAYLCVFNGGEWKAIHWGRIRPGTPDTPRVVTFTRMGRNIVYLPAVFDGSGLVPAAPPQIVTREGRVLALPGTGEDAALLATSVAPKKVSPDTQEVTPVSHLKAGTRYVLHRWSGAWHAEQEAVAGEEPVPFTGLPADALYWLRPKDSRRLERVFTIEDGRQRWW